MSKDYYHILGILSFEDNQDVILRAYKEEVENIRQKIVNNPDLCKDLIDINEAYLVLSDVELKKLYDYTLSSHKESSELSNKIEAKRKEAEEFVYGKMKLVPKRRKKRIWPAILCGFFLLSALGQVMRTCSQTMLENGSTPYTQLSSFNVPADWDLRLFADSFTIRIPPSLEEQLNLTEYNAPTVFQQKGLSDKKSSALNTYCRLLIQYDSCGNGEVEHHNETSYITYEDRNTLRRMCSLEIEPWSYIEEPSYRWIDINGIKALEAKYSRTGKDGPVSCKIYILPNFNELARIIVEYKEEDSDLWQLDMDNVIKTFRWTNPK